MFLLILKIKLFIKYENTFLILNNEIYNFFKSFILKFLNNFKLKNFDDDITLEVKYFLIIIKRLFVLFFQFRNTYTINQFY